MTDNDLRRFLARLPEPDPPADFDATVMSVIAAEMVASSSIEAAQTRPDRGFSAGAFATGLIGAGLFVGALTQRGWTEATASLFAQLDPALLRLPPADTLSFQTSLGLVLILVAILMPQAITRTK